MEVIPLSETFAATCAKALTFIWISRFEVPKTITSDRGPQFTSNLWVQLCEMLNISHKKQQLITLSRKAQSKDCTAVSRTRFVRTLPRQHGPRSYPLYSSDSEHSRGKTLIFPQLRQFSVHKLSCQMNFCKIMNFQLTPLSKIFLEPCMFLPLLCLDTILAPTCPASCQPSCSLPPSSGSVGAAWFHPFNRFTTASMLSCTAARAPSPSESVCGTRKSPSAALRLAWLWTPRLAARISMADRRAHAQAVLLQKAGLLFRPAGFFTFSFISAATRWSRNCFPTRCGGFCTPGTGGAFTAFAGITCPVSGHRPGGWTSDLFSSQPRPELGGRLVESCRTSCCAYFHKYIFYLGKARTYACNHGY
jgi:hypothetical protein